MVGLMDVESLIKALKGVPTHYIVAAKVSISTTDAASHLSYSPTPLSESIKGVEVEHESTTVWLIVEET